MQAVPEGSVMSDERNILAHSLPPEEGSDAAAAEARLPRKGPGCPLSSELILHAQGSAAPAVAARVEGHLPHCADCRRSFAGFARALARQREIAAVHDGLVRRSAELFNRGASADRLLEQTGESAEEVLRALCAARDDGLLESVPAEEPALPAVPAAPAVPSHKSLLDLLRERGGCLRNVTVRQSGDPAAPAAGSKASWVERIRYFGSEVGPQLLSLLSESDCVGVGWGRTVAAAISGLKRACESPPPRPRGPLVCVATVGGLVGELKVRAESSSSILASRLAETVNGDWEHLYTLHGLEAFISFLDRPDEFEAIRRRIERFPNYQAIFGSHGQPGVIDRLDTIITSCGDAHHYNQFWTTELPRIGVSPEKLNRLTHGNIGGVLLERAGLDSADRALFADIARRWTGITRRHYEQCARRKPGVVLLALGDNKADVVLRCVSLGLVTELIIDEDLALALWDKLDPENRYPRTLEAVLCRQVQPRAGRAAVAPGRSEKG
jgi:DNA-binding transcriptional regulator LsrR (DeoR family)